jgi:hypothetical protein
MITSKHNRRALNKRQLSIALIGNVHCFERRKLYSQATQKYVIASSNLNKQFVLIEHHLQNHRLLTCLHSSIDNQQEMPQLLIENLYNQ